MTQILPARAAGSASLMGAVRDFADDVDRLFVPPRQLAAPADRATAAAARIDWAAPTIIIWVPGTSHAGVAAPVAATLRGTGRPQAVAVDYHATWRLRDSVSDGEMALRALLDIVARRRRRGQRVVLLGESQGAWVISSVLRDPRYRKLVHRAGLVAHPGAAPAHAHASIAGAAALSTSQVREFNRPGDLVTRDLGAETEAAIAVVDSFARLNLATALGGTIRLALRAPSLLSGLVSSQLFRMRGTENPHAADDLLGAATAWATNA